MAPRPHFPGFEILRAVSSIFIVIHHAGAYAGADRIPWGHQLVEVLDIGVPIFFVTSGFLIYRPLVAARFDGRPRQRLVDFWWRRLLRVVPAYWLALTVFWAMGNFRLGDSWWRFYLFVQVYDPLTVLGGLVQAWTLAAEVAFYLTVPLWALLVGRLVRRAGTRRGRLLVELGSCAVLWAGAIFTRFAAGAWWKSYEGVIFTWLPANMDTFAWGMAFASLSVYLADLPDWRQRLARIAGPIWAWWAAATAVFAWYGFQVGPSFGYTGFFWQRRQLTYLLVGLLVVFPVVFGRDDQGLVRRVWTRNPIPYLGAISYGLYLWHFDWIKRSVRGYDFFYNEETWQGWLRTSQGNSNLLALLVIGFGTGLTFASLSWYLVERPLQRYKGLFSGRGRNLPVVAAPVSDGAADDLATVPAADGLHDRDDAASGALGREGEHR